MTTALALAALIALGIVVLAYVLKSQAEKLKAAEARAEQAERDRAGYQRAFEDAETRASRLKQALTKNAAVEKETNNERQALAATPDTELVHRANGLFGGVSDKPKD
jgi:chromosome segregation ATPase